MNPLLAPKSIATRVRLQGGWFDMRINGHKNSGHSELVFNCRLCKSDQGMDLKETSRALLSRREDWKEHSFGPLISRLQGTRKPTAWSSATMNRQAIVRGLYGTRKDSWPIQFKIQAKILPYREPVKALPNRPFYFRHPVYLESYLKN